MTFGYKILYCFLKCILLTFYRLKFIGQENIIPGSAILAPSHTSYLDPIIVGVGSPEEIWFVGRKTLFKDGFIANFLTTFNTFPITGTNEDRNTFRMVGDKLQNQKKVLIFPEGERSLDEKIQPIKPGFGMIALRNNCPIIPVYIDGAYQVWKRGQKFPYPFGKITCIYGTPIHLDEYAKLSKKEAQEQLSLELQKRLNQLQAWFNNGAKGVSP